MGVIDVDGDRCCIRTEILGGICEEGDLIDFLSLLVDGFNNLNEMSITLPGHQG